MTHLRKNRFAFLPAALVVCLLALGGASSAAAAPTQAKMADAVVESIGLNTHLNYSGTPYDDFAKVRASLRELGIRHIRDQIGLNRPDIAARFRQLGSDGIRLNVIAGDPRRRWGTGTVPQQLDVIQNELAGAVASIEGPNEYDLSGFPNWAAELRTFTRELAEGVRSRPKLASMPIIGPSIVIRENEESIGDLSQYFDYGNTHTYMGGEIPETSRWNDDLAAVAHFAGSDPVMATETGYQNALRTNNGHLPTSEKATAIYMPRLFLDSFRRGIVRSYGYQLLDERSDSSETDIEASFGLLRNDFSMKPAGVATRNLISLLADKGPAFAPRTLDYRLEGAPATTQQLLLQKRDGSFYLALWNRVSVWDRFSRVDLQPPSVPVTVRFGQPIAAAEVFEPSRSATAVAGVAGPTDLKLSLSSQVQIVKLTTATSGTPAPSEPAPVADPPETPEVPDPVAVSTPPTPVASPTPAPIEAAPAPSPPPSQPVKRTVRRSSGAKAAFGISRSCRAGHRRNCRRTAADRGSKAAATPNLATN